MRKIMTQRNGATNVANNGVRMTIINYKGNDNFDVQFEDNTIVTCKRYRSFVDGNISHPTITTHGRGKLGSFILHKRVMQEEDITLYHCTCEKCGVENILTPQEMLKHEC